MVTYKVDSDYSAPSYSASWLHKATSCGTSGLCMSGAKTKIVSGVVKGDLAGSKLTGITGELITADGQTVKITDGTLGGVFDWFLETEGHGKFIFVDLKTLLAAYSTPQQPNSFNADDFVLWGQNFAAHGPRPTNAWGIDLRAVLVPEPDSVALLLLGLLGLGLVRRRQAR